MFAPSTTFARLERPRLPRLAVKLIVVAAQSAVLVAFAVAGTIFLGLTIQSPIVVPLAERHSVLLSAAELASAQAVAAVWWLFAIGTVLSFGAALATLGNLMQRLAAPPEASTGGA